MSTYRDRAQQHGTNDPLHTENVKPKLNSDHGAIPLYLQSTQLTLLASRKSDPFKHQKEENRR